MLLVSKSWGHVRKSPPLPYYEKYAGRAVCCFMHHLSLSIQAFTIQVFAPESSSDIEDEVPSGKEIICIRTTAACGEFINIQFQDGKFHKELVRGKVRGVTYSGSSVV